MARWRPMRSSAKPLSAPNSLDRSRNRGWIRRIWSRVSTADSGTVTKNTTASRGESTRSITKDPATVSRLVQICKRSVERVALTVSTS